MCCPRCSAELYMRDVFTKGRHATVMACPKCEGLWMRHSDLERLSEVVDPVLVERVSIADGSPSVELPCPQCDDHPKMLKQRSSRDARVVMDGCARCGGVWLDGGELRAIQQESVTSLAAALLAGGRPAAD